MKELKPCPFCGGESYLDIYDTSEYEAGKATVYCGKCGVSTPTYLSDSAILAWNSRKQNNHADQ